MSGKAISEKSLFLVFSCFAKASGIVSTEPRLQNCQTEVSFQLTSESIPSLQFSTKYKGKSYVIFLSILHSADSFSGKLVGELFIISFSCKIDAVLRLILCVCTLYIDSHFYKIILVSLEWKPESVGLIFSVANRDRGLGNTLPQAISMNL